MGNYNVTITNEGAALLASVIANQGTITFTEARLSSTNYVGQEQTLTEGTFSGTFLTTTVWASVVSAYPNEIRLQTKFSTDWIYAPYDMYSVGIIGTDGNTTALVCVLTTSNPDRVEPSDGMGNYYNFRTILTVSSTSDITVVGTTAAVLYDTDIVDNLTTADATKVLSANMGHTLGENVEAIVDVYGAKNLLPVDATTQTVDTVLFTIDENKVITINGTASTSFAITLSSGVKIKSGNYAFSMGSEGVNNLLELINTSPAYDIYIVDETIINIPNDLDSATFRLWVNGGDTYNDVKIYPMLRDARITDPTFVPPAKTNLQLTNDKAERADLATLNLTGSTNTTGSTINEGVYFYLNGSYCKAKTSIANGATFTLNTNFEVVSVGGEITALNSNLSDYIIARNQVVTSPTTANSDFAIVISPDAVSGYKPILCGYNYQNDVSASSFQLCSGLVKLNNSDQFVIYMHSTRNDSPTINFNVTIAYIRIL